MTFSYNLVLALFLMAPGFAAYAGLFFTTQRDGRLHPAPPAPNSVITLAIVTLAALFLHASWALILFLQGVWADHFCTFVVPFNPNIYADLLSAGSKTDAATPMGGGEVMVGLWSLLILSVAGYFIVAGLVTSKFAQSRLQGFLYGWAAELVEQIQVEEKGYVRFATAFILTNIEHDGHAFGYEGALLNMALNADKEITSIAMTNVTAFYVKLEAGRFKRIVLPRTAGIPNLYMEKAQIRNVSFQVFRDKAPERESTS